MRYMRLSLSVMMSILAISLLVSLLPSTSSVVAQEDGDQCVALSSSALVATRDACTDLVPGQVCFGHTGVSSDAAVLTTAGDTANIADLNQLTTTGANVDTGTWGVAMLTLPANLPEGIAITAVLYGDAQIARPAQTASDRPTLTITNGGGAPLNLRNGAGITYELVGQLEGGTSAVADGRNEQADWVRIQFGDVMAWVFTPLITWEGDQADLLALEVLLPNDVTPAVIAAEGPFQAFTLVTTESACEAAPSGMLLQYSGDDIASLVVNQTTLDFADATLLLTAAANDVFEIKVLTGSVTVTARGIPKEATGGEAVSISLGGEDGYTPTAPPVNLGSYTFPEVAYAPLDLMPSQTACMVGVAASNAIVQLRVGPGEDRGSIGTMSANKAYTVIGWANDPQGSPWWQLDTGGNSSWVDQKNVRIIGDCAMVAEVEAPPLVFAPGAPVSGGDSGNTLNAPDFSPAANTVWQMVPGTDNLSGQCSGAPAINFCDHLAAIAPAQGGITWRGMEPSPYFLSQIQPNVYAYAGPNVLNTGTINLTLTFTGEATLKMTMSLVLNSEPDCTHIYYYSGTKNW